MVKAVVAQTSGSVLALLESYQQQRTARRRKQLIAGLALALLTAVSAWVAEVDILGLASNIGRFTDFIAKTIPKLALGSLAGDFGEWFWGIGRWLRLLKETLLMAYAGTLTGAAAAFGLCFLASRNLVESRAIVFTTRRLLEFCRTVPEIVFALIFVLAFGLGPLPGVLAISIHTAGALGKLFAEVVENIDMKPVEGVMSTGGGWSERVRFAVLPQVLSNFVSYALLRFEVNVRSAAILGFVGAGGIGQDLLEAIRKFYYTDVSAILVLIITTVMVIDMVTERVRHRLTGWEAR